ncbi:hypothetical protein V499_04428, partial [Pseudogymnoascus sp. VKM F-103]
MIPDAHVSSPPHRWVGKGVQLQHGSQGGGCAVRRIKRKSEQWMAAGSDPRVSRQALARTGVMSWDGVSERGDEGGADVAAELGVGG